MSSGEVTPTGGVPGSEDTGRPKIITCPCCESVIFRNGELKKKGPRIIELEKAESENEKLTEELAALQEEEEATPPAVEPPITPENSGHSGSDTEATRVFGTSGGLRNAN